MRSSGDLPLIDGLDEDPGVLASGAYVSPAEGFLADEAYGLGGGMGQWLHGLVWVGGLCERGIGLGGATG